MFLLSATTWLSKQFSGVGDEDPILWYPRWLQGTRLGAGWPAPSQLSPASNPLRQTIHSFLGLASGQSPLLNHLSHGLHLLWVSYIISVAIPALLTRTGAFS